MRDPDHPDIPDGNGHAPDWLRIEVLKQRLDRLEELVERVEALEALFAESVA